MKEVLQSVFDLHYFFIKFRNEKQKKKIIKKLTVLKQKFINFQNKKVTLAIIGESHFLVWDNYLELLSCVPLRKDGGFETLFESYGARLLKESVSIKTESGNYTINIDVKKITKAVNKKIIYLKRVYKKNKNYHLLSQKFPGDGNPSTHLWFKMDKNKFNLITCHLYPNEGKAVWTKSKVRYI